MHIFSPARHSYCCTNMKRDRNSCVRNEKKKEEREVSHLRPNDRGSECGIVGFWKVAEMVGRDNP